MNAIDYALPRLKTEEGFRATKYTDSRGHTTIGYGFDVDAGISQFAAAALLNAQVAERHNALLACQRYV